MSKRVYSVPGFGIMTGNVSGKQNLVYPSNANRAYEAPEGKKSYAQNYRGSIVVSMRKSDGLVYFGVKTKSCINMTPAAKKAMAVLGGAAACYNAIKLAGGQKWDQIQYNYDNAFKSQYKSIRQYAMSVIMEALRSKSTTITFGGPTVATFQNPWVSTATQDITLSTAIVVKFWSELAANPITFTVEGRTGVAHSGETFGELVESNHNSLQLTSDDGEILLYGKHIGHVDIEEGGFGLATDSDVISSSINYEIAPNEK